MKRLKAITKRVTSSSSKDKEKESSSRRFSISSHKDIQVIRGGYNIDLTHVDDSFTQLHRSCLLNEPEDKVAKCITSQGINPNQIDQVAGSAPLHLAIVNGNLNNVRVLLTHGADVDLKDGEGKTPLIKAIESSHEQLVKFLVYNNANPNLADTETGNTALMWALQTNMISSVKILMGSAYDSISSFPVDVNRRNVQRETALHVLAKSSLLNEVLPLVLENQAMVNVQNEKGRTPLMVAASHGNRVAVEAFLKKGADCSLRDSAGITALDIAKINGFPEISSLIEGHQENLTGSSSGSFRGRLVGSDPSPGQAILMNWSDSDDDNENESSIQIPVQLRMKQQSVETRRSSQVTRQSKESNQDLNSKSNRESVSSFNPVIEQLQLLQGIEKKKNTNEEGGAGGEVSDSNLQPSNVRRSLLGSLSTQIDQQHQVQQTRQQQKQLEREKKVVTENFVQGKQAINETVGNKNQKSDAKKSVSLHLSSNEGNKSDRFSNFQTIPLHWDSDEDDDAERDDTDDDNMNRMGFLGKSKGFESSLEKGMGRVDPLMTPPEELDLQPAIIVGMHGNSSSSRTSGIRSQNNTSTNDDFIQNLRDLLDEEIKSNDDLDDLLMTDAFSFRPSSSSVNTLLGSHDQADPFNYQPTRRGSTRGSANLSSPNQEEQDYPAFFSNDFSDVNEENSKLPHHQQSLPNKSYQRSGWKEEEEGLRKSSTTTDIALNPSVEGNRDERGGKNKKQSHDGVKDMTGATYFLQHPSFSESTDSRDSQEGTIYQENAVLQDQNQVEVKSKGKQQETTVSQQKGHHHQQHLLNPLPALLVNHHSGKETNHKDDDLGHEEDEKKEKVKSDRELHHQKERFVLFLQEDDEEDAKEQVSESEMMIKNNEGSKDIIYSVPHKGTKKKEDDMQRKSKSNYQTGTITRVMGEEVPTPFTSSPLIKNTSVEGVMHGKSSSLMAKTTTGGEESNKSKSASNRSSGGEQGEEEQEQEKSGQSRLESNRGWKDSKTPTSSADTSGNNNSVKSSINKTPLAVNTGGGRGLPPVRPLLSLHHLPSVLNDGDKGKETGKETAVMINPLFNEEMQQEKQSSFTQRRLSDHHHKDYQENAKGVSSKTEASSFEDENKRSHAVMIPRNQGNDNVDDEEDSQEEVVTFDELDFEVENVNVMNDTIGGQTGETSQEQQDTRMSIVRDSKGTSIVLPLYPFRQSSSPIFSSHDPSSGIFRSPSRLSTKESFDEVIRLKELYEREKMTRARIEHDLETIKKSGHDDDYHILLKTKIDLEEKYFELRTKHSHLTFDVDKINSEKKQLEKQLDLMKTQEKELLNLRQEREDLFTQTLHLKQQVNTVRDEMNDSLQVLEQRVQELLQSNTQLTQQNNSLKKELKLKESEVTKMRMEHEADLERVKREKESLSLDRDTLRTQLQHLQGQMSGENNASTFFNRSYEETNLELVKSIKDLNNAINHLNERTLQLQEQQAENDRDVAMTPALIIDMKSLIQDLNQQVSSLKSLKHQEPGPNDLPEISSKLSLVKASLDRLEDKLLKVDQDTSRKTSYIVNGVNGHPGDSTPVWINPSKHAGGHDNNLLIYPALLSRITVDRAPKSLFVRNLLQLEDKNSSNSSLKNNNFHDIKNNLEKEITVLKNQLGLFCSNFQAE